MITFLLIIVYLSFISLGLPDSLLGSAWPLMGPQLGADPAFAGIVQFAVSSCTVFSSMQASRFLQRFGTGKVVLVSVSLTAVALMGYSLSSSPWMLLPCAVFLGLGAGAVDTSLSNYVALHFQAKHMSWLHCCWGVGAMSSTCIMASFLRTSQWRWGFRTVSILLFSIATCLALTQKLWQIYEKAPVQGAQEEKIVTNREAVRLKAVKPMMLAMLCYNGLEAVAMLWMPTYFIAAKGMEPDTAAACCSAFYIGITLGRVICGAISEKIGDRNLIRWGIVTAVCGVVLLLLPLPVFMTTAALFVAGFGGAPIFPSIVHAAPKQFGEQCSATVIGLEISAAYVGASCLPFLSGFVSGRLGMVFIPMIILVAYVIMLISTETANRIKTA